MPLNDEERMAIVVYRLEKAENTFAEARDCASMKHWTLTANRLYYAAYYACSALLISKGYQAKTHEGTLSMIGRDFIKTGILSQEDGVFLARLQNMRHTGDYDDFLEWTEEDIEPYIPAWKIFLNESRHSSIPKNSNRQESALSFASCPTCSGILPLSSPRPLRVMPALLGHLVPHHTVSPRPST